MNLILSFIGKLPDYIIDCIYQIRLFYKGEIYLILDDYKSIHLNEINIHNIKFITYDTVNNNSSKILMQYANKFAIMEKLNDRKFLFFRAFERMFLVNELINKYELTDNIFMEIDNLIYDNPEKWIKEFSKKELAFMCNDNTTCSTCLMYIKNKNSMKPILDYMIYYTSAFPEDAWNSEMGTFKKFNNLNSDYSYIIPTLFKDTKNNVYEKIYENYTNTIFDPLSYGTYLLGMDVFHTAGVIVTGKSIDHYYVICNRYKIEWKITEDGYKKPFILDENDNEWKLINNLHVHSKDLKSGLSKDI